MKNLKKRVKKAGKVVLSMVAMLFLQIQYAFCQSNILGDVTDKINDSKGTLFLLFQAILGIVCMYSFAMAIINMNSDTKDPKKNWIIFAVTALAVLVFEYFKS